MVTRILHRLLAAAALVAALPLPAAEQSEVDLWATLLKPHYFGDTPLIEGRGVIDMKTPYRSEDAAFTPVSITASST